MDDEPLEPDEVTSGDRGDRLGDRGDIGGGSLADDVDRLARRAVDAALLVVRRAMTLGAGVLFFALVAAGGGFLLGLAALSGGIRTVWILLGGTFALVAVGAVATALWRLRRVRSHADALVSEVQTFLTQDEAGRRAVVDTVRTTESDEQTGLTDMSRGFVTLRGQVIGGVGRFRELATALSAITTFPGLLAISVLVSIVFVGLSAIFLLALAL